MHNYRRCLVQDCGSAALSLWWHSQVRRTFEMRVSKWTAVRCLQTNSKESFNSGTAWHTPLWGTLTMVLHRVTSNSSIASGSPRFAIGSLLQNGSLRQEKRQMRCERAVAAHHILQSELCMFKGAVTMCCANRVRAAMRQFLLGDNHRQQRHSQRYIL